MLAHEKYYVLTNRKGKGGVMPMFNIIILGYGVWR